MSQPPDQFPQQERDGQLLAAYARRRDEAAFAKIVQRHGAMVLGVCRGVLGNRPEVDDAVQAVFLTLARRAAKLTGYTTVAGWLHQTAWYVAMRAVQTIRVREEHEREAARMRNESQQDPGPAAIPEGPLHAGLAKLPAKYRTALILHHVEGRTQEETARALGCSVSAASVRLVRGRQMLRKHLLAMGVATWQEGIESGLRRTASVALPAAVAAGVLKASASGGSAAAAVASQQAVLWSKGAIHMMFMAKLKAAAILLMAIAIPAVVVAAVTHEMVGGPEVAQLISRPAPAPVPAPAPDDLKPGTTPVVWPGKISAVDYVKVQTDALVRKLDVSYRRAYASEVVADLEKRSGVRVAYPQSLDAMAMFTLEAKGLTVKDILEKLGGNGRFDLAFRPDRAVLTQKAPDNVLADLQKQLASTDRWDRCAAVWSLGELADMRIYPLLAKGLQDSDAGVVGWTLMSLEKHYRMGAVMADAEKDAVVTALSAWLSVLANTDSQAIMGHPRPMFMLVSLSWTAKLETIKLRTELLASTGRPAAIAALAEALDKAKYVQVRCDAAQAMGAQRVGAAELLAALLKLNKEVTQTKLEYDRIRATVKFDNGWPPEFLKANEAYNSVRQTRDAVLQALIDLQIPEFIRVVQGLLDEDGDVFEDQVLANQAAMDHAILFDLRIWLTRQIHDLSLAGSAQPMARGGHVGGPKGGGGIIDNDSVKRICSAITRLNSIADPGISAVFQELVADDSAFDLMTALVGQTGFLPTDDPALIAALIARLDSAEEEEIYAIRCLGLSHDPRAADALIKLLNDKNWKVIVAAAEALGQTRDPRALAALAKAVQENRKWDEPEGDAMGPAKGPTMMIMHGIMNPRRALIYAMQATRDPETCNVLLDLAQKASMADEVRETASWTVLHAPQNTAQADKLVAAIKGMDAAAQREFMMGSRIGPVGWTMAAPVGPVCQWCQDDARWIGMLAARAPDEQAFTPKSDDPRYQLAPRTNPILQALAAIRTPTAEKATLDLTKSANDDVTKLAKELLTGYFDPAVVPDK